MNETGNIAHAELPHHRFAVTADGLHRETEPVGSFFAGLAHGDEPEYFHLAVSQSLGKRAPRRAVELRRSQLFVGAAGYLRTKIRSAAGHYAKSLQQVLGRVLLQDDRPC